MSSARRAVFSAVAVLALVVGPATASFASESATAQVQVLHPAGGPFTHDPATETLSVAFFLEGASRFTAAGTPNADGYVEIALPPGAYNAQMYYAGTQNVLSGWAGGLDQAAGSATFVFGAGETVPVNIDLSAGATLTGSLTADDFPLDSASVYLFSAEGEILRDVVVSFDSEEQRFRVTRIPPGTYYVSMGGSAEGQPWVLGEWLGGVLGARAALSDYSFGGTAVRGDALVVEPGATVDLPPHSLEIRSAFTGTVTWPGAEPDSLSKRIQIYRDGVLMGERGVQSNGTFTFRDVARHGPEESVDETSLWSFCVKQASAYLYRWAESCWSADGTVPHGDESGIAAQDKTVVSGLDIDILPGAYLGVQIKHDLDGPGGSSPRESTSATGELYRLSQDGTEYRRVEHGLGTSPGFVGSSALPAVRYLVQFYDEERPQLGRTWWAGGGTTSPYLQDAEEIVLAAGDYVSETAVLRPVKRSFDRVDGADRFSTAVQISRATVTNSELPAPVVYIASGRNYPDALSAGPLAAQEGGTLLLVEPTSVPASIRSELSRLDPQQIVVVGGTAAVSAAVERSLRAYVDGDASRVTRIAGADRYTVSRALVSRAAAGETGRPLFIATGRNYPDALSAGPAAAALGGSVLLVDGAASRLSGPTRALIDSLDPSAIVVVGGPAGVSDGILRQMQSRYGGSDQVFRIGGPDRYSVSVLLNSVVFAESSVAFVATGASFADALAGGPLVARYGAPLYLTQPSCLPSAVSADITALRAATVVVLGGPGAVSGSVTRGAVCRASAAEAPVSVAASALVQDERDVGAAVDSMREVLGVD